MGGDGGRGVGVIEGGDVGGDGVMANISCVDLGITVSVCQE